jgi:DNA-binding MarR family transcriptional regulator/ribosomal protein S18 acetylase RimI-like enzyme
MESGLASRVAGVRKFNRFYTRQIGLLRQGLLGTSYSLSEARMLYELSQGDTTAAALAASLDIDPGFLSRMLRRLGSSGLVTRTPSAADRRQAILKLSAKGRAAFAALDSRSQRETATLLAPLADADQRRLVAAMTTVEALLRAPKAAPRLALRPFRSGDLGWVLARHAALYAEEYGWGRAFELLVADVISEFLRSFDPAREACWIAEVDSEPVGSVMLVDAGNDVAKLRLLLVEPRARGLGVGRGLVEACVRFARDRGYRKITLWTQSVLVAARAIYRRAGFTRIAEEPHRRFEVDLVGETWELELGTGPAPSPSPPPLAEEG